MRKTFAIITSRMGIPRILPPYASTSCSANMLWNHSTLEHDDETGRAGAHLMRANTMIPAAPQLD